jgi:hypothetical protein
MIESNAIGDVVPAALTKASRSGIGFPGAELAETFARKYGTTIALALRATLEVVGFVSVAALLTLGAVPASREPFANTMAALWSSVGDESMDDEVADDADEPPANATKIGDTVALDSRETNVAIYLARRYHVADEAVRLMVATAQSAGKEHQVDPLLILAVVAVESSMNPFAQSPVGATGLMQVMPAVHGGKFVEGNINGGALDPVANIQVGTRILSDVIRRGGSIERGLQLYVGAGNAPDDGGYAVRVLAEFARLRQAAGGQITAALAAGMRADIHAPTEGTEPASNTTPNTPAALAHKPRSA